MNIKVKNEDIKLKKDYLTSDEVVHIITKSLEAFDENKENNTYAYNFLSMLTNFYVELFYFCIEGYNSESESDYDKYYSLGVHKELLEKITNAKDAYDYTIYLLKESSSFNNILSEFLNKISEEILTKLPNSEELKGIANKIPKEWKEVLKEYTAITGKE